MSVGPTSAKARVKLVEHVQGEVAATTPPVAIVRTFLGRLFKRASASAS